MIPWAAVVGFPVEHSLSPRIFGAFQESTGRPLHYRALAVEPGEFESALKAASLEDWVGWNLTLPHKVAALALMDEVDASAKEAGAVNVVHFQEGRRIGYNTDAEGFLFPLSRDGVRLRDRKVLVLGAGGAARAVCAALRKAGAGPLMIANRAPEKARELAEAFKGTVVAWEPEALRQELARADLAVNATSLGMDGRSSPLPEAARFKKGALAYDLVYRPKVTPFLRAALDSRARALGGLGMLVAQAAATWKIWFSETLPREFVERVEAGLEGVTQ